jgi:hypothetical protein
MKKQTKMPKPPKRLLDSQKTTIKAIDRIHNDRTAPLRDMLHIMREIRDYAADQTNLLYKEAYEDDPDTEED